jgi:CheY-like chemotaxis protein
MLRCLIVDDSWQFLTAAQGWLERQGVAVAGLASTAAQAVHQAAELRPDVVLVDIDLGRESGFDVAEQLQAMAGPDLPVILISAYAEEDYTELIAASSAVGFLSKTALSARGIRGLVKQRPGHSARPASTTEPKGM